MGISLSPTEHNFPSRVNMWPIQTATCCHVLSTNPYFRPYKYEVHSIHNWKVWLGNFKQLSVIYSTCTKTYTYAKQSLYTALTMLILTSISHYFMPFLVKCFGKVTVGSRNSFWMQIRCYKRPEKCPLKNYSCGLKSNLIWILIYFLYLMENCVFILCCTFSLPSHKIFSSLTDIALDYTVFLHNDALHYVLH